MKLTENFTLEEMVNSTTAQIKNIDNTPDGESLMNLQRLCSDVLQPIRDRYGKPIRVTSGYRSEELNRTIRGASTSQHRKGEAADIVGEDNKELWRLICKLINDGIIKVGQLIDEKNLKWIHISLPDTLHKNQILHL